MRRLAQLAALAAAGLACGGPLMGQESAPAAAEERVFAEAVEVSVVNVEVYVTDKKGNLIRGLGQSDFELLEDGRPMEITNFYAVADGRPVRPGAAAARRKPADAPVPSPEPAALPESQRLYLIVYVDNFNIRPFNRNRVFTRLRQFLTDRLDEDDRVMLVSYDRTLKVRHPFTNDPRLIASVLFDLERVTGHALMADSERREQLETIDGSDSSSRALGSVRQYAASAFNDLRFTIDALKELVDSLAGLEGRKALIYVSDGLPMTPGEDLFHAVEQKFPGTGSHFTAREFDGVRYFQQLTHMANENRVTIYTLDAAGLRVPSSIGVQNRVAGAPGVSSMTDSIYISNLQSPLRMLADETGGLAVLNTNDVGAGLDQIATDLNTYYSLGYSPSHAGDGRYHRIEVKVKRKGLRARHREGYRDKSLTSRMTDGTLATLHYGYGLNPMQVDLEFEADTPHSEKDRFIVPLVVRIPLARVTLVPRETLHEGRVRVFVSAMDQEGRLSEIQEMSVPIQIPDHQLDLALEEDYHYRMELMMRSGGHRVAVGVRDEIGAVSSFVRKPVMVGAG